MTGEAGVSALAGTPHRSPIRNARPAITRQAAPEPDPLVEAHLDWCRIAGLSPQTIYQRRRVFVRLHAATGATAATATREHIGAYLARQTMSAETRAVELSHLRSFYRWATEFELLDRNPTTGFRRPSTPRGLPRPISEDDLHRAIAAARQPVRVWLVLAAGAGLRCGEIAKLRREHIDLEHRRLEVPDGKGGRPGVVPLASWVADELADFGLPETGWLFPHGWDRDRPIPAHRVSQNGALAMRRAGVDCTMHQLRHRFGTLVYRTSGRDLRMTQELLRHSTPIATAIYTQMDMGEAGEVVEALPSITPPA